MCMCVHWIDLSILAMISMPFKKDFINTRHQKRNIRTQDPIDDMSTLVQTIKLYRQATSYYLRQCWHRSLSPERHRPQCVWIWYMMSYMIWCTYPHAHPYPRNKTDAHINMIYETLNIFSEYYVFQVLKKVTLFICLGMGCKWEG